MSIIDIEGGLMPDAENKQETSQSNGGKETQQEGTQNQNAEHGTSTGNGNPAGQANTEQVDLAQIHDMLKEKDAKVDTLTKQVEELKKANTELLLKVNAGASKAPEDPFKVLYDEVVNHK